MREKLVDGRVSLRTALPHRDRCREAVFNFYFLFAIQELIGPKDSVYAQNPLQIKIIRAFVARYLRIIPTAFAILKIMRA